jgi:uncharacterized protein (DUF1800 family)
METSAAQAFSRFGLGAGDNGISPETLKAQLRGPDPGLVSPEFAALPGGQEAVDTERADQLARKALLTAPEAEKADYKGIINQLYRQDALAQTNFAISTPDGFRERLVWFWANHFSVSTQNQAGPLVGAMLREAIRPHVTGKFTDMVLAVERHPAMLRYLNNAESIGPNSPAGLRSHRGLNENLGRECMELHTVGVQAGYSQTDVTNMAKILTGWGVATSEQGSDATGYKYFAERHEPGPQTVMGQNFDGGEQAGIDALTYLSTYPTTYTHIATKLVTHFVADNPPPHAVAHIAGIMRESGGDLAVTSAALVDLPQAWVPGQKLKTPFEYVVSLLRAAPPPPEQRPPEPVGVMARLGQPVWGAPLPNGWQDQASYWAASDAILERVNFAFDYAARFGDGPAGPQPADIAHAALGPLLRPATYHAMQSAGSRREALTLLFSSPEFMRR